MTGGRRVATQSGLGKYLATRVQVWNGGPGSMFSGLLAMKPSGSAYVPLDAGLMQSVGFWRPDAELTKGQSEAVRYEYGGLPSLSVRYVGVSQPVERIPAGALVRVSLSRAFAPSGGPNANWLQLSGWYPE